MDLDTKSSNAFALDNAVRMRHSDPPGQPELKRLLNFRLMCSPADILLQGLLDDTHSRSDCRLKVPRLAANVAQRTDNITGNREQLTLLQGKRTRHPAG